MKKNAQTKRRKLFISGLAVTSAAGLVSIGLYYLVTYARSLTQNAYVSPLQAEAVQSYGGEPKAVVSSQNSNGEEGFVVTKGPLRVRSSYRALFDAESLVAITDWLYANASWGANALSLTEVNFSSGIETDGGSVTMGTHTDGRDISNIVISPDAFEDVYRIASRVLAKLKTAAPASTASTDFKQSFDQLMARSALHNSLNETLKQDLVTNFQGQSGAGLSKQYTHLSDPALQEVVASLFDEIEQDNFFTTYGTGANGKLSFGLKQLWAELLDHSYLGDKKLTNLARIFKALETNQFDSLFGKALASRLPLVLALKLVAAATGGKDAAASEYLRQYLPLIISAENGLALDGQSVQRNLVPSAQWSANWAALKSTLGVSEVSDVERVWELFQSYHQMVTRFLNDAAQAPLLGIAKAHLTSAERLFQAAAVPALHRYIGAPDRARFLLAGDLTNVPSTNLVKDDQMFYSSAEWAIAQSNLVQDRKLSVVSSKLLNNFLKTPQSYLAAGEKKPSISEYYRTSLVNSMRYAVLHEMGHHETMWSTFGDYQKNYYLHYPKYAATSELSVEKTLMAKLFDLGKVSQGFQSISDNIRIANDHYSGTISPTYVTYNNFWYRPADPTQADSKAIWDSSTVPQDLNLVRDPRGLEEPGEMEVGTRIRSWFGPGRDSFLTQFYDVPGPYVFKISPTPFEFSTALVRSGIGSNIKLPWPIVSLVQEYQVAKWLVEFAEADDIAVAAGLAPGAARAAFEAKHKIFLPKIEREFHDYIYNFGPSAILSSTAGSRAQSIGYILGIILLKKALPALSGRNLAYLAQLLKYDIFAAVKDLYEELISEHPNLFIATDGQRAIDDYSRSLIVVEKLADRTRAQLKIWGEDSTTTEKFDAPGIYLDPSHEMFKLFQSYKDSAARFDSYRKGDVVTKGTAQNAFIRNTATDYANDYPEFLTRAWLQLSYRPDTNAYIDPDGKFNFDDLQADNANWYTDMAALRGHGLNLYNFDPNNGEATGLSLDGARLVMWYRQMLGLHSNIDWSNNIPQTANGQVDLDALDASLDRASILQKVYRHDKTGKYAMWGWFTAAEAARYKYVVLRSSDGTNRYVPLHTKDTSNYFYYADLTNKTRRSLTPGYVQWASDWFIGGNFTDSSLLNGDANELLFAESLGGTPVSLARTYDDAVQVLKNNDYEAVLARILATVDPKQNRITIVMRG